MDRAVAAGILREMARRDLAIADVRKITGISKRRSREFSEWLKRPSTQYGLRPALGIAEALGVPLSLQVADLAPIVVQNDRGQRRRLADAELAA